jgi:hypothetical protein
MRSTIGLSALAALALLSACGGGDEAGVGGVTADEAAQLNNAAEMLDASPDGLTAPEDMPLDTESNSGAPTDNAA